VYSPEGKQLAYVSTGKELPTNVRSATATMQSALCHVRQSLYTIRMVKKGYQLRASPLARGPDRASRSGIAQLQQGVVAVAILGAESGRALHANLLAMLTAKQGNPERV